jgi:hypothetical protein
MAEQPYKVGLISATKCWGHLDALIVAKWFSDLGMKVAIGRFTCTALTRRRQHLPDRLWQYTYALSLQIYKEQLDIVRKVF